MQHRRQVEQPELQNAVVTALDGLQLQARAAARAWLWRPDTLNTEELQAAIVSVAKATEGWVGR